MAASRVPLIPLSDGNRRDLRVPRVVVKALAPPLRLPPLPRVYVRHLLESEVFELGTRLVGFYKGAGYHVTVTDDGHLRLDDGRICRSPSAAAKAVSGDKRIDGWRFWHYQFKGHLLTLADLRERLLEVALEQVRRQRAQRP